ncbi:MAG: ABC-2 family transporter protein [Candidatus Magasanikbacteria bacterium]
MGKYLAEFKFNIQASFAYRGVIILWIIVTFLQVAVLPFVWLSVYGTQDSIVGFSKSMMITYFVLIPCIDVLVQSWADFEIKDDIKEGRLNTFLIKPINYLLRVFWVENGWKVSRPFIVILIVLLLYPFIHTYFQLSLHARLVWILPAIIASRFLNFLISSIIGMAAFWTVRSNWALQIWWALQTLAAGYVAPLSFYPPNIQKIISYTPFPMLLQTPINIILDNISTEQIVRQLLLASLWIIILLIISNFLWKKGVRKTEGIGM